MKFFCVCPACSCSTNAALCSCSHPTHCSRHALYFITLHSEEGFFCLTFHHFALDHSSGVQMVRPEVDFMPASVRIMDRLLTRSNQSPPPPRPTEMTFGCVLARACVHGRTTAEERDKNAEANRYTECFLLFKYLRFPHRAVAGLNSNTL